MKRFITGFVILSVMLSFAIQAEACTLWAATGDAVAGGGTLIAKNRDWMPDHYQELRLVTPTDGFRYYGIFAVGNNAPGLKAGINEQGLVVVSASASSIARSERLTMDHMKGLLAKLLADCDSVDAALAKQALFIGPQFLLLADRHKIAVVEIAPEAQVAITVQDNGMLYHTNHYVHPDLVWANKRIGNSSRSRLDRIGALLDSRLQPLRPEDCISFSEDRAGGPDNGIWRSGSTEKAIRTLSAWIVALPQDSAPQLYVKLANPGEDQQVYRLEAGDIFR